MIFQCFPNKPAHVYYFLIATSPGVSSLASSVLTARSGRRWRYSPPDSTCGANVNWSQRILRAPWHWFGEAHRGWCRAGEIIELNEEFSSLPCLCTLRIIGILSYTYSYGNIHWGISLIIYIEVYLLGYCSCWQPLHRRFHEITRNIFGDICSFPKMQNGGTPKSSKSLDHFSIETHGFVDITP